MGLTAAIQHWAFGCPRAFPVLGRQGVELWQSLLLSSVIQPTASPHNADLLLLLGEIPSHWAPRLYGLLETLPLPRLLVQIGVEQPAASLPVGYVASAMNRVDWREVTERLLDPDNPLAKPLLPDHPPHPWRGLGDHGQGGEGMMGGYPYGRSMAMTSEDPYDNLALDDVATALGPHFPGLPSGLELTLQMQGDRLRICQQLANAFPAASPPTSDAEPALAAVDGAAVPITTLETARLRNHLAWLAVLLDLSGYPGLAQRVRSARHSLDAITLEPLLRRIESSRLPRRLGGIGIIRQDQVRAWQLDGPVARAAGLEIDPRTHDAAYRDLGFELALARASDCRARLAVRLAEIRHSLALLSRAGDATTQVAAGSRGTFTRGSDGALVTPSSRLLAAVAEPLAGLEWFEALLHIHSLDLDLDEASWQ